jgi:hypothetical protein
VNALDDAPLTYESHWDDSPPAELVQAITTYLEVDSPPTRRQAARVQARAAVTGFMRRHRADGAPSPRSMAVVRAAFRRAMTGAQAAFQHALADTHAGTIDHLPASARMLREEVVRWALHAEAPVLASGYAKMSAAPLPAVEGLPRV